VVGLGLGVGLGASLLLIAGCRGSGTGCRGTAHDVQSVLVDSDKQCS